MLQTRTGAATRSAECFSRASAEGLLLVHRRSTALLGPLRRPRKRRGNPSRHHGPENLRTEIGQGARGQTPLPLSFCIPFCAFCGYFPSFSQVFPCLTSTMRGTF